MRPDDDEPIKSGILSEKVQKNLIDFWFGNNPCATPPPPPPPLPFLPPPPLSPLLI